MRIPVGNFGYQTADTASNRSAPPVDAFVQRGGEAIAGALTNIAGDMRSEQIREERQREAEAKAAAKEQEAEFKAAAKEATRVKSITAQGKAKNELADFFDRSATGLADGSVDKNTLVQKWGEESQKIIDKAVSSVGQEHQELIRASLLDDHGRAQRDMRKMVAQQDRQDIAGGIVSYTEQMQRYAMRGDTQRMEAIKNVDAFMRSAGPQAGIKPADIEKSVQGFKEGVTFDYLVSRVSNPSNSSSVMKQLAKDLTADKYPELDPAKRNTLLTTIFQRQEAAAARAERESQGALKRAEAEFNTYQSLVDKGTILSPEYIDRTMKMTAGTAYQNGVKMLTQQAAETGGLASKSVMAQQATLDSVDKLIATQGRTPALDKRREQVAKVLDGSQRDLRENGLRAGLERGVITELTPVDFSTPEAISKSIANRIKQAETVSMWAGKSVSPFDAREAEMVRNMLDVMPPKQKSQTVATIAAAVGPRFSAAISEQINKEDRPLSLAFAMASSKTTGASNWLGNQTVAARYTSELILQGAAAIKDGTVMADAKKVTGWKATIANELDGVFPNEKLTSAAKDSAYYIAGALSKNPGEDELKRAVQFAIGGNIIERNGKKLPVPFGFDEDDLNKRLKSVTAAQIITQAPEGKVRAGGVEVDAETFAKSLSGQELLYAGPGRYAVIVKGRPVMNSANRPIIISVQ